MFISTITEQDAGEYLCYYVSPAVSLMFNEPLDLMVTGDGTLRGLSTESASRKGF
jgi:hypothetical protein